MPVTPYNDPDLIGSERIVKYPNPFFDLSANYIPKNIKTLFKYCRDFYKTNGFLNNVVTKLAEYPVTDILYDNTIDQKTEKKYNEVLHDILHIKSFLIEIGLDYFTFGNVFISTNLNTKRFLVCSACKYEHQYEDIQFKVKKFEFWGTCPNPKCMKKDTLFSIKDEVIKSAKNFKLIRWAPENIDIIYNPITARSTYLYKIPSKVRTAILAGNRYVLQDTPVVFLEALKLKKDIELDSKNLYHFKMPALAEEDMGWGTPIVLPALRDIYYLQILRKGNEAIANEHIVPKKVIFPSSQGSIDPFQSMNLGNWRANVEGQIKKWKLDPNHIGIFPIPMGYQQLGGDAKLLNLTQEMRFIEETIINSLGIPLEFIKGGTSWTGSSISLRIVENHFLTYRELLLDFMNYFLLPKINAYLSYGEIKVKFKKFKMTDDAEAKQLSIELNAAGKISDSTLLEEFGFNSMEELEGLKRSRVIALDDAIMQAEKQADAQGKATVIMAKYQAKAEKMLADTKLLLRAEAFQSEIAKENSGMPEDPYKLIEKYAVELFNTPEPAKTQTFAELQFRAPVTASFVLAYMQNLEQEQVAMQMQAFQVGLQGQALAKGAAENAQAGGANPNNKKTVGTREQDKVKVSGEKHKGPTKGQA